MLVVSLALTALATVASATSTKKNFSVQQKVIRPGYVLTGPQQVLKTFTKYQATPPEHVKAAAASSGSVVAAPGDIYDSLYICKVTVGSQQMNLDFDTGSSDLWVFSDLQPVSEQEHHNIYQTIASKKIASSTWSIGYSDGSNARGVVYKDSVTIGGLTVTSQGVEAATHASYDFINDYISDGLVGLAFSSINSASPRQKTFLDNITPNLSAPVMVADLKYHAQGSFDFGYIDPSKYRGSISYSPADYSRGFWGTKVSGYGYPASGSSKVVIRNIAAASIVDTGTTLIYLPRMVIQGYYAGVQGASNSTTYGGYIFPCTSVIPDLVVKIGSFTARIPAKYLNYAPVEDGSTLCFGGLQDSAGLGLNILGDVFIKSVLVVFENSASPRLGFAQKVSLP